MNTSFYTAAVGTVAQERGLEVTANNVANLSTDGYKPDEASFADLVYTNIHGGGAGGKTGHGNALWKTDTVFTPGVLRQTGRKQDYALPSDNAFFAVKGADGTVRYTRSGGFLLSEQTDGSFLLCDGNGAQVLDGAGEPITVRDGEEKQNVGVFSFRNRDGLRKTGGNDFAATDVSGPAVPVQGAEVKQGYLEGSATDLTDEVSNLIMSQRAFEFNAKMVKISDEIMQTMNNLR